MHSTTAKNPPNSAKPRHAALHLYASALLVGLALTLMAPKVFADSTQVGDSMKRMGQLNGVALACGQMALSQRIKDVLLTDAPKSRLMGEQFEEATNAAFLAQGAAGQVCPEARTLAEQINQEKQRLQQALAH